MDNIGTYITVRIANSIVKLVQMVIHVQNAKINTMLKMKIVFLALHPVLHVKLALQIVNPALI